MQIIEQIKLSDFFQQIKHPEYILGTTYTLSLAFFESVVLPCINQRCLKSCLIISDQLGYKNALSEGSALRGAGQHYTIVAAPVSGCFHAKVWIVIGESEFAILAGSGNLTQSGFMLNAELFDALIFSKEALPSRALLQDISEFILGLVSMWNEKDSHDLLCLDILNQISRSLQSFSSTSEELTLSARFLHSFHSNKLIDQLPDTNIDELYIASPFFGNSLEGINLLSDKYPDADLHIFPAIHNGNATDIPLGALKNHQKIKTIAPLQIKKKCFAHLKLYGLKNKNGDTWIYCTSANCTSAAWNKKNIEAGILRKIDSEKLIAYFTPGEKTLPKNNITYNMDYSDSIELPCWAIVSAAGFNLTISSDATKHTPLKNVELKIHIGSYLYKAEKNELFANGTSSYIPWTVFDDFKPVRNITICLELTGENSEGKKISSGCFIENHMFLTADPIHRSAWNGVLELLDSESLPNLADISAIFTLVGNIFDGRAITAIGSVKGKENTPANVNDKTEINVNHIAIWPPQPVGNDKHRNIGTSGMGQLMLCQKILGIFLNPDKEATKKSISNVSELASDDLNSNKNIKKQQQEQEARAKQFASLRDKIWKKAEADYNHLINKLQTAVPTETSAKNIWVVAVIVFLTTMAVRKKAISIAGESGDIPFAMELYNEFLQLMFNGRKQHPNFCCPKNMRYRHVPFPALAHDLRKEFNIEPHSDLIPIILAMLVDKKIKSKYPLTQYWPRVLDQVMTDDYIFPDDIKKTCLQIWHIYIREDAENITDDIFSSTFDELIKIKYGGGE